MARSGGAKMCEARKFVFIIFVFLILTAFASVSAAKTIYVPDDYARIQWAVDNVSVGDTIVVSDGVYVENIKVDKKLTITSENGPENCIVRAANLGEPIFHILADNVTVTGFTIREASYERGITINNSKYSNIWNSTEPITYTYNGKTYTNYLGNYWSDHECEDANGDGICYSPYVINSDNQDNYPLVKLSRTIKSKKSGHSQS